MATYYCDNHSEFVVQKQSNNTAVHCPICSAIMTFGKWSIRQPDKVVALPDGDEFLIYNYNKPIYNYLLQHQ